jgi:agmatinase
VQPPSPHPFLAASTDLDPSEADAIIVGLAADGGVSFRSGAIEGPTGIRRFSESIETWSPRAERDLSELQILDAGDHDDRKTVGDALAPILDASWSVLREGLNLEQARRRANRNPLLVSIGGDHSVTPPAVAAVASRVDNLAVIGFDAHLDLREDYPGDHACTYRRISDNGVPCYVFGLRSGARHEWDDAPKVLTQYSRDVDVSKAVEDLTGRPVYVTIDIDVIDPSEAPGTGNPEPGGTSFIDLLGAIESLSALHVVAVDVVEVSPPLDPSGITQAAAAVLLREAVLRFARL